MCWLANVGKAAEANRKESTVDKILDSSGVAYTHHNDEIVKQNEIEVEKARELLVSVLIRVTSSMISLMSSPEENQRFEEARCF